MSDFFFGDPAVWFTMPALIGTGVFMIRSLLMIVGGDADVHHDFDIDFHGGDAHVDMGEHGHSSEAFQVISIQSLFAFLMGFGWAGFGAIQGAGWAMSAAIPTGILGGVATVWLLGKLLTTVYGLQSKGNIQAAQALELEGTVYIRIPENGQGKGQVRVVIDDHERYLAAVSDGVPIDVRTPVRVVSLEDESTVVVTPVGALPGAEPAQD